MDVEGRGRRDEGVETLSLEGRRGEEKVKELLPLLGLTVFLSLGGLKVENNGKPSPPPLERPQKETECSKVLPVINNEIKFPFS